MIGQDQGSITPHGRINFGQESDGSFSNDLRSHAFRLNKAFTPAVAYTNGQCIGGLLQFAVPYAPGSRLRLNRFQAQFIYASEATFTAPTVLFFDDVPSASADGAVPAFTADDLGLISLTASTAGPPTLSGYAVCGVNPNANVQVSPAGKILAVLLSANGGITWTTPGLASVMIDLQR